MSDGKSSGHEVDLDADLAEVILNKDAHALALLVAGVGDDRELDRIAALVEQLAVLQVEAIGLEAFERGLRIVCFGFEFVVEPEFVGRRNRADGGLRVAVIDDAARYRRG